MLENKQTILADIIMLATDKQEYSSLIFNDREQLCFQSNHSYKNDRKSRKRFHLYATTDEEIKEGDWAIDLRDNIVYKFTFSDEDVMERLRLNSKKIVATTNPELWVEKGQLRIREAGYYNTYPTEKPTGIAKIDTTFLQPYVDAYNSGKPITQVRLEMYQYGWISEKTGVWKYETSEFEFVKQDRFLCNNILKLKPNGSVIIHPVIEQKYSFEQMVDAILNNTSMTIEEAKNYVNKTYNF